MFEISNPLALAAVVVSLVVGAIFCIRFTMPEIDYGGMDGFSNPAYTQARQVTEQ